MANKRIRRSKKRELAGEKPEREPRRSDLDVRVAL